MTKKTTFNFFMTTLTLLFALTAFSCAVSEPSNTSDPGTVSESNNTPDTGTVSKPDNTPSSGAESGNNKPSTDTKQPENQTNTSSDSDKKSPDSPSTSEETTDVLHVVIYGIGIRGKNVDDDGNITSNPNNKFAILYNQTEEDVNISNWKIKKAAFNTSTDSDSYKSTFDIPADTIIKGKQYLLLTRYGYDPAMWNGDVSSDIYLEGAGKLDFAVAGNHVILVDTNDSVIDRLDYIELKETKQKTWERKYDELYITANTNAAYIFRKNPAIDTNIHYEDFTSQTIGEECILKNSTTVTK